MAHAMLFPEPKPGKRIDLLNDSTGKIGFDKAYLSRSRTVLRAAPNDLAPSVLAGGMSIDAAVTEIENGRPRAFSRLDRGDVPTVVYPTR